MYICICMYKCMCAYMYVCIYVYLYICIYLYVYMYIYVYMSLDVRNGDPTAMSRRLINPLLVGHRLLNEKNLFNLCCYLHLFQQLSESLLRCAIRRRLSISDENFIYDVAMSCNTCKRTVTHAEARTQTHMHTSPLQALQI